MHLQDLEIVVVFNGLWKGAAESIHDFVDVAESMDAEGGFEVGVASGAGDVVEVWVVSEVGDHGVYF